MHSRSATRTRHASAGWHPLGRCKLHRRRGPQHSLGLFGGALLLVGLFTRPVGFILSGFMAVAYFMAHAPQGFFPILNGGELAALYCFVFFYFVFAGGGAWSLDAMWRRPDEALMPQRH